MCVNTPTNVPVDETEQLLDCVTLLISRLSSRHGVKTRDREVAIDASQHVLSFELESLRVDDVNPDPEDSVEHEPAQPIRPRLDRLPDLVTGKLLGLGRYDGLEIVNPR